MLMTPKVVVTVVVAVVDICLHLLAAVVVFVHNLVIDRQMVEVVVVMPIVWGSHHYHFFHLWVWVSSKEVERRHDW